MFPLLSRRLQSSARSAALPWWRRLAQSAATSPAMAPASSVVGQRALASFAGGPFGPGSSSSSRSRPFQQRDGRNSAAAGSSASATGTTNPLGVPHFEIRVYDMEEALEALTRQHSVPLGYVLPVEDRPAPSVDGPPLSADIADALPRIAPTTAAAEASSCEEEASEGAATMHCIKRTYQPSVLKRKRAHGFLSRLVNSKGKKILARRRQKHRSRMGV